MQAHQTQSRRTFAVVLAAALLSACTPPGRVAPDGTTTITGRVVGLDGRPIPGATARVAGDARAVSNAEGVFSFDVSSGAPVPVEVASAGHVTGNVLFPVAAGHVSLRTIELIARAQAQRLDAAAGGSVPLAGGAGSVAIAPGSLVDAAGRPATGDVFVRATYIDPRDPRQVRAAPGNYVARDSLGELTQLATRGMVEVVVADAGGAALRLAPGRTAAIAWPRTRPVDGALYAISPNGYWQSVGPMGEITPIQQIGTFNWDETFEFVCIRVAVDPRMEGVTVTAMGVAPEDYESAANTDRNGVAVLGVKPSSSVMISISSSGNPPIQVQTPAGPVFPVNTGKVCPRFAVVHGTLAIAPQFRDRRALDGLWPRDWAASTGTAAQ